MQATTSSLRQAILKNALKHVHTKGWTQAAIVAGTRDAGYPPVTAGVVESGPIDLVRYFMRDLNTQTSVKLRERRQGLSKPQLIREGVKIRLELQAPYLSTWPQAMALGAQPQNLPGTLHDIAELADDIWHIAGDRSVDTNWYTKRGIVSGVYTATELFMLLDKSANYSATWEFLDRRIENAITLGEIPDQAYRAATSSALFAFRTASDIFMKGSPFGQTHGAAQGFASMMSSFSQQSASQASQRSTPTATSHEPQKPTEPFTRAPESDIKA